MTDKLYDLKSITKILFENRLVILIAVLIGSALSTGYSFLLKDEYTSKAVLKVTQNNQFSNQQSSLGSFAGILGAGGAQQENTTEALELLKSRNFILKFVNYYGKEKIFPENDYFINLNGKNIESAYLMLEIYREKFNVYRDSSSGYIHISFQHPSRIEAFNIVTSLIDFANITSREEAISKNQQSINSLKEILKENQLIELEQVYSNLFQSYLSNLTMANIDKNYLLDPIDPPYIPEIKSYPSRLYFLILGFVISFFSSLLIVIFLNRSKINA